MTHSKPIDVPDRDTPANERVPHLHARDQGQGPALVILHGLFGNLDNFASIARPLSEHWRVIRLDLPGHGRSASLTSLDYPSMARAVKTTLQELEVGPCHLLGHSMGGKVAMTLAGFCDAPTLWSLVVVDIAPRRYPAHHTAALQALSRLPLAELPDRSTADRMLAQTITDAGVRAFLLKSLSRAKPSGWRWQFDLPAILRDYDRLSEAAPIDSQIDLPTLFVKGGDSDYLNEQDSALVVRHFSRPTLRTMAGTGHWPHAEKPALFSRVVETFLKQHTPTDRLPS